MTVRQLEPDEPRYELRLRQGKGQATEGVMRQWDNMRQEWGGHLYVGPEKEQEYVDKGNEWWDKANCRRAYSG